MKALSGAAAAFVVSMAAKKAGTCSRLPQHPARFLAEGWTPRDGGFHEPDNMRA